MIPTVWKEMNIQLQYWASSEPSSCSVALRFWSSFFSGDVSVLFFPWHLRTPQHFTSHENNFPPVSMLHVGSRKPNAGQPQLQLSIPSIHPILWDQSSSSNKNFSAEHRHRRDVAWAHFSLLQRGDMKKIRPDFPLRQLSIPTWREIERGIPEPIEFDTSHCLSLIRPRFWPLCLIDRQRNWFLIYWKIPLMYLPNLFHYP